MSRTKIILSAIWTVVWLLLSIYLFMPTLSFTASTGIYWNLFSYFLILALISVDFENQEITPISKLFCAICAISFILMLSIGLFGTWGGLFGRSSEYRALIGEVKETTFTSNIQPIAPNQMIIVDKEIARRIGEKELGSDPGLGSRAELGEFTLQSVNKQLYWIAPIEHSGYWKWNTFKNEGTPGYVYVSATNQEDYKMVTEINGKKLHIKYQTRAYFSTDLTRHIYSNGYGSTMFTEKTFEVDDNWNPYWTVTIYDSKIGFEGDDAIGVLTVDPETGKIEEYPVEKAPEWIDRIQPESFVSDQIDDWGELVNGYWNWSGSDKITTSQGNSIVLGNDQRSYFYFGLTSKGNENSTVGFMMVDTRTKKVHWFRQAGATEDAAKKSAEGKVQEKGYVGSDGITYNIGGYPTYEFLLKDKGGLMKLIALVNVHDHTIVGIGENRHEAIRDYTSQLNNRGNSPTATTSEMQKNVLISKIKRFNSEVVKGNTFYHFIFEKEPNILFSTSSNISNEIPLTKEDDIVKIIYIKNQNSNEFSLINFDNLSFGFKKDSIIEKVEFYTDSIRTEKIINKSEGVSDDEWSKLSPEEKQKILNLKGK